MAAAPLRLLPTSNAVAASRTRPKVVSMAEQSSSQCTITESHQEQPDTIKFATNKKDCAPVTHVLFLPLLYSRMCGENVLLVLLLCCVGSGKSIS